MSKPSPKPQKIKRTKYKVKKEEYVRREGQFPLNPSNSDRVSFSYDVNDQKEVVAIENVSYEALIQNKWERIIRFDDHGGKGEVHGHERVFIYNELEVPLPFEIFLDKTQKKKELLEWAIKEISINYVEVYRTRFCKRNSIDLY